MSQRLPFPLFFALISFVAAYFLWPSYFAGGDGLPKWIAQIEAALCGFAAAYMVGSRLSDPKVSTWICAVAGVVTMCLALLLTAYVTAWSYYLLFRVPSPYPAPNPITAPGLAFVFWVLYFAVRAIRVPEIALLDFAGILGAMSLVRHPQVRWATWGSVLALLPLIGLVAFRSIERTVQLSAHGYGPSMFIRLYAVEVGLAIGAAAFCCWVWRSGGDVP